MYGGGFLSSGWVVVSGGFVLVSLLVVFFNRVVMVCWEVWLGGGSVFTGFFLSFGFLDVFAGFSFGFGFLYLSSVRAFFRGVEFWFFSLTSGFSFSGFRLGFSVLGGSFFTWEERFWGSMGRLWSCPFDFLLKISLLWGVGSCFFSFSSGFSWGPFSLFGRFCFGRFWG